MIDKHFREFIVLLVLCGALFSCGFSSGSEEPVPSEGPVEETTNSDSPSLEEDTAENESPVESPGGEDGSEQGGGESDPVPTDADCPQASHFLDVSLFDGAGNGYPTPRLNAYCTAGTLVVESNGIPHYEFQQTTPNDLAAQEYSFVVPKDPQLATTKSEIPFLGTIGVAVNGIPFFGPNEAANLGFGDPVADGILDWCMGHTGAGGTYHYHAALVECLTQNMDPEQPSPVVGYALDGFPIYGSYGCVDEGCSEVIQFQSSWVTTGEATAAWDNNVYVEKTGNQYLDECNGRIGEDGTYRYHLTQTFPYVLGCYSGELESGGTNPDPPEDGGGDDLDPGDGAGGPPACVEEADCDGLCPQGSVGCTCHQTPGGNKICVPECETDTDCPEGAGGQLVCNENQGICIPAGGPGGQP